MNITAASRASSLSGLRGLAILYVLFSHLADRSLVLFPGFKISGFGAGQQGVYLFIVLSSFLLFQSMVKLDNQVLLRPRTWVRFALRRILRIYPLYSLVLVVMAATNGPSHLWKMGELSWSTIPRVLLLMEGPNHLWVIKVFFLCYLLIPPAVLAYTHLCKRNLIPFMGIVLSAAAGLETSMLYLKGSYLIRYGPMSLAGILCAVVYHEWRSTETMPRSIWFDRIGFALLAISPFMMPNFFRRLTGYDYRFFNPHITWSWGLCAGVLVLCVAASSGPLKRIFSTRLLIWTGDISFSAYLLHWPILVLVLNAQLPRPVALLLFFSGTALVAGLSYRFIEHPLSKIVPRPGVTVDSR